MNCESAALIRHESTKGRKKSFRWIKIDIHFCKPKIQNCQKHGYKAQISIGFLVDFVATVALPSHNNKYGGTMATKILKTLVSFVLLFAILSLGIYFIFPETAINILVQLERNVGGVRQNNINVDSILNTSKGERARHLFYCTVSVRTKITGQERQGI